MSSHATLHPADPVNRPELCRLAEESVQRALSLGATDAEAVVIQSEEFHVNVRLGQVEQLTESGSRALGLRVFFAADPSDPSAGCRTASTSTSDLSPQGLSRIIDSAVQLARVTGPDPFAGLPEREAFGAHDPASLALYFDDVPALPAPERIDIARRAEAVAMACDPRIRNSSGADFSANTVWRSMINSRGFSAQYRSSYCGFSVTPIAQDADGAMQRDFWYSSARTARLLQSPEEVGRIAAQRALRRLGARRVTTQHCPVVFAPEVARSLMGNILGAANGDAIYRKSSIFADRLGEKVAGENITMVDDGAMVFEHRTQDGATLRVGGFGASPFDGDGLPTRRTVIVERGILRSLMLNTYTARKLSMSSTAKASRGLAGTPGIGGGNYFLQPGDLTPEQIIADVPSGLYVLQTMGHGVNLVTGDYSVGAGGLWIENGELAFPVEQITIAGNLKDIFCNVVAIGNDLEFRSAGAVPTIRVEGMTVAGS
ncbi:MAG: TldD/PmbA family protein [Acidobacteriaceae bacterium]